MDTDDRGFIADHLPAKTGNKNAGPLLRVPPICPSATSLETANANLKVGSWGTVGTRNRNKGRK